MTSGEKKPPGSKDKGEPGELALEYLAECERRGAKPNVLLLKRLDDASDAHARGEAIALSCIGSEKETFLHRLRDNDLLALLQSLKNKGARVRHLDLSFHCFGDEIGRIFLDFLSVTQSLETLRLKSNLISERGASKLCDVLANCPSLSLLDLSQNALGREGGKAAAVLIGNLKSLRALDLSDCQLHLEAFVHLTTAVQTDNRSLEILNLANPAITFNCQHSYHVAGCSVPSSIDAQFVNT
ncbi:leucine rich repeat domain-containing protein [Cyclospora cayetanensis]|uniref:Leucine rich repeat domain-containing protein n=1 Tax=Cyclospora cayetanensis TaxID=88456 RepID=A0A1D3D6T9_9EIME|nr:leucine rich repeat domain-containing protein [Cyclospora cayetanensis]